MRLVLLLLVFSPAAFGAGKEVYKAKCALCHVPARLMFEHD